MAYKNGNKIDKIQAKINKNIDVIKRLQNENNNLILSQHKLCSYHEEEVIRKEGRKKVKRTIGYRKYAEDFVDEETGEVVTIHFNIISTIDGMLADRNGNIIKYNDTSTGTYDAYDYFDKERFNNKNKKCK